MTLKGLNNRTSIHRHEASLRRANVHIVGHAELVELCEIRVDGQFISKRLESRLKWHVEGTPHLLRDVTEGALATGDLLVELLTSFSTTAMLVEQDMPGVLHEDRAIEICRQKSLVSGSR